jgi:hypothetical protein
MNEDAPARVLDGGPWVLRLGDELLLPSIDDAAAILDAWLTDRGIEVDDLARVVAAAIGPLHDDDAP